MSGQQVSDPPIPGGHFVARTAAGLPHGNTLALRRLWTVVLYIDAPALKPAQQTEGQDGQNRRAAQTGEADQGAQATQNEQATQTGQDAPSVQTSWRLVNDDGSYEKTLPGSEAAREDEKHLALRFTDVVSEGDYSLYHVMSSGAELPVFLAVPFAALEDHGEETPEPSAQTDNSPTLAPEPEALTDDPLLLHDPVDHKLDPSWYSDFAGYPSDALQEDSQGGSRDDSQDDSAAA